MTIREGFIFFFLTFVLAGYVLMALLMFARLLSGFVSRHRAAGRSAKGPAHVNRPDRGANVAFEKA
jgi:hypothetical protein